VLEIKRQFDLNPNLLIPNHPDRPDYDKCIAISTEASLSEMVPPAILVMFSPIICGVFFGTRCVTGLLAGGIASGVQMAISSSNTGGAWDNAKKYISKGAMNDVIAREEPDMVKNGKVLTKKSQIFKAAVTGDTVGDPLKDTSGPALNILMKLMAIISVVFAPLFLAINNGGGLIASTGIVAVVVQPKESTATAYNIATGTATAWSAADFARDEELEAAEPGDSAREEGDAVARARAAAARPRRPCAPPAAPKLPCPLLPPYYSSHPPPLPLPSTARAAQPVPGARGRDWRGDGAVSVARRVRAPAAGLERRGPRAPGRGAGRLPAVPRAPV
jgi:inorganic pyrophosphatase